MREPPWRAPSEPSCAYQRPGSLFEILKVQSDVGNASLNHAANFRVELLGMVAHNGHGHDVFSHRQVRFSALGTLGPTPAHRYNRTGFDERLKHLFNFSGFRVEFLHWMSPLSASCGAITSSFSARAGVVRNKRAMTERIVPPRASLQMVARHRRVCSYVTRCPWECFPQGCRSGKQRAVPTPKSGQQSSVNPLARSSSR